jgi:predicted small metal-binding protein
MTKVVHCRDVGFDCDGVVRATTEEEALKQVAEHARTVHNLDTVSDEVVAKVRSVMRDEPVGQS